MGCFNRIQSTSDVNLSIDDWIITYAGYLSLFPYHLCNSGTKTPTCISHNLQSFFSDFFAFSALTLSVGWQEGHPACNKTQCRGAGVVTCLEQGADLHMAQLMPLPLSVSCFTKIKIGCTFLLLTNPGCPGQRAVTKATVQIFEDIIYRAKLSVSSTTTGFIWLCVSSTSAGTASLLTEHMALDSSS